MNWKARARCLIVLLMVVFTVPENIAEVAYNHPHRYNGRPALADIFTRKVTSWEDGSPIVVYIKPLDSIEHAIFVSNWLGMSPTQYIEQLKVNTSHGQPSVTVVREDYLMLLKIATTPNSIGYADDAVVVSQQEKAITIVRTPDLLTPRR